MKCVHFAFWVYHSISAPGLNQYLAVTILSVCSQSNMTEHQISWKWIGNVSVILVKQHLPLSLTHCSMKCISLCRDMIVNDTFSSHAGQPARWGRCSWNTGGNIKLTLLDQDADNDKTNQVGGQAHRLWRVQ